MFPFNHMFPYTDYHDVNLDWLIREVEKIKTAEGVSFDDTINIDADNVQSAIEKIKALIDEVATQSQKIALIDNQIPAEFLRDGYTYSHLQTINDPTISAIIDAMRNNNVIILKVNDVSSYVSTDTFLIQANIKENTSEYWHEITLFDPFFGRTLQFKINGLNDDLNVNAEVYPTSVKEIDAEDVVFSAVSYTAENVKDALVEVDQKLTDFEDTTTTALDGKQDTLTFDNVPTAGSDNPVKSDGIKSALDGKQDTLTFDSTPTLGSNNPCTSDGIRQAITASTSGVSTWNGRTGDVIPASGDYNASQITTGTFPARVNANATAEATLSDSQVRNISAGTTDLTDGVSVLATGEIYLYYEP